MNKAIEFRVYDPRKKKYFNSYQNKGWAFFHGSDEEMEEFGCYSIEQCIDFGCIVQQFTGMYDKNNKKIFEGDIIKGKFDFGPAGMCEYTLPVQWHNEFGYQWEYWDLKTIEVTNDIFKLAERMSLF